MLLLIFSFLFSPVFIFFPPHTLLYTPFSKPINQRIDRPFLSIVSLLVHKVSPGTPVPAWCRIPNRNHGSTTAPHPHDPIDPTPPVLAASSVRHTIHHRPLAPTFVPEKDRICYLPPLLVFVFFLNDEGYVRNQSREQIYQLTQCT